MDGSTGAAARHFSPWSNMEFPFSRKASTDFFFKKTEGLRSSLTEGSSKLLDSAKDSKSGLFGGFTSGISQISQRISGQEANGSVPDNATAAAAAAAAAKPKSAAGATGGGGGGGGQLGAPQQKDLFAVTPTSAANLPSPGLQPEPSHQRVMKIHRDSEEIFDDSDADSQATEGADDLPMVTGGGDYGAMDGDPMRRSDSVGSELSWESTDSHLDEQSRDARDFMKCYITKMFDRYVRLLIDIF